MLFLEIMIYSWILLNKPQGLWISKLVHVLQSLNLPEIDSDEVECICAMLISNYFIRGYISHQKKALVLSKNDPFPKPSSFLNT